MQQLIGPLRIQMKIDMKEDPIPEKTGVTMMDIVDDFSIILSIVAISLLVSSAFSFVFLVVWIVNVFLWSIGSKVRRNDDIVSTPKLFNAFFLYSSIGKLSMIAFTLISLIMMILGQFSPDQIGADSTFPDRGIRSILGFHEHVGFNTRVRMGFSIAFHIILIAQLGRSFRKKGKSLSIAEYEKEIEADKELLVSYFLNMVCMFFHLSGRILCIVSIFIFSMLFRSYFGFIYFVIACGSIWLPFKIFVRISPILSAISALFVFFVQIQQLSTFSIPIISNQNVSNTFFFVKQQSYGLDIEYLWETLLLIFPFAVFSIFTRIHSLLGHEVVEKGQRSRSDLLRALDQSDIEYIEDALQYDPDFVHEFKDEKGNNIVHLCVLKQRIYVLRLLLHWPIIPQLLLNATNESGVSPLHMAAALRLPDFMKALASKGADLEQTNPDGEKVLKIYKDAEISTLRSSVSFVGRFFYGIWQKVLPVFSYLVLALALLVSLSFRDYLHGVYLACFILFCCHPKVQELSLPFFVFLCEVLLAILYISRLCSSCRNQLEAEEILGDYTSFNQMYWLSGFMLFAAILLRILYLQIAAKVNGKFGVSEINIDHSVARFFKEMDHIDAGRAIGTSQLDIDAIVKIFARSIEAFSPFLLYLSLIVAAFSNLATAFKWIYLVFLCIFCLSHAFFSPEHAVKVVRVIWFLLIPYSAIILVSQYLFQYDTIADNISIGLRGFLRQSGFMVFNPDNIFWTILPQAVVFALATILIRFLPKASNSEAQFSALSKKSQVVGSILEIIELFLEMLVDLAPHMNLVLAGIIVFTRPDIIGIIYLCFILLILQSSRARRYSWLPFSLLSSISICFRYIMEVDFAGTFWSDALDENRSTWSKWGFGNMNQQFWEADGLILDVILLGFCVTQRLAQFAEKKGKRGLDVAFIAKGEDFRGFREFINYSMKYLRYFIKQNSRTLFLPLTIYLLLFTAFARLNIFSVIYISTFVLLYTVKGTERMRKRGMWVGLVAILTVSIFYQYLAIVFKDDIRTDVLNPLSDKFGRFLGLKAFSPLDILYDFFCLYFAILHKIYAAEIPSHDLKDTINHPPDSWKQFRFALQTVSDKVVVFIVFLVATNSMDILRLPIFLWVLLMLFRFGLGLHHQSYWKYLHFYITLALLLSAVYQVPGIPANFGINAFFDGFTWESVLGLRKLDSDASFSNSGVLFFIVIYILVDLQLSIYQMKTFKTKVSKIFSFDDRLSRLRNQESFFQYQQQEKKRRMHYTCQKVKAVESLEKVFSLENQDKLSWTKFYDEELWPFSAKQRNSAIGPSIDINALSEGFVGINQIGKIDSWNLAMGNLTGLSRYQVVHSDFLKAEDLPISPYIGELSRISRVKDGMSAFIFIREGERELVMKWFDAVINEDVVFANSMLPVNTVLMIPRELFIGDVSDYDRKVPLHVEVRVEQRIDEQGNVVGAALLFKELVRLKSQYILHDINEKRNEVLNANDPAVLIDSSGMITSWNSAFSFLYSSREKNFSGISVDQLFAPSTASQRKPFLQHVDYLFTDIREDFDTPRQLADLERVDEMRITRHLSHYLEQKQEESPKDDEEVISYITVEAISSVFREESGSVSAVLVRLRGYGWTERVKISLRKLRLTVRTWMIENSDAAIFKTLNAEKEQKLKERTDAFMFGQFILSQTQFFVFITVFLELLVYGSLLHTPLPIIILIYGLLENPDAPKGFWVFVLLYQSVIILLKLVYQLDIFCTDVSGEYNLQPSVICIEDNVFQDSFLTRRDFVIGIRKAIDGSIARYIVLDFIVIMLVSLHRFTMELKGSWDFRGHIKNHPESDLLRKMKLFFFQSPAKLRQALLPHRWLSLMFSFFNTGPNQVQRYFYSIAPADPRDVRQVDLHVKPGKDFYMAIFLIEFLSILYTLLFWGAIDATGGDIQSSFTRSRFPGEMVLFLFLQVAIVIFDRVIYLNKFLFGKVLMQYFTVVFFHYFFFVDWPGQASVGFQSSAVLVIFYIFKLVYWVLSALQIRYGYKPFTGDHNFLTKKVGSFRAILVSIFYAVPLLYELRTLLSWICIPTSLGLSETFLMEDMYYKVFLIKCDLDNDEEQFRGEPEDKKRKCRIGSCFVFLILVILLGPILLFSDLNPSERQNNVIGSSIQLSLRGVMGEYEILRISSLASRNVLSKEQYSFFQNQGTLSVDDARRNTQLLRYVPFSDSIWIITDQGLEALVSTLRDESSPVFITFTYQFTRPRPNELETVQSSLTKQVSVDEQKALANVISSVLIDLMAVNASILLSGIFPGFVRLSNNDAVDLLDTGYDDTSYLLTLQNAGATRYWKLTDSSNTEDGIEIYSTSDPIFDSGISTEDGTGYGIIAFYVVVVLTIANFLRLKTTDQMYSMIYDEMLNVDDLLTLCEGVYIARYMKEYKREETLYRILVRVFRSPEMMLKLTVRKSRLGDAN